VAPIPFFLVTGFLGSGKTTFLKTIINNNTSQRKIAIIQNEYAPANIDGEDLKQLGKPFDILEINNGSVFCVCLLGDFITALKAFIETENPDLVILESSGLSDPIAISEILQSEQIKNLVYLVSTWCIIDSLNFNKVRSFMTRVEHQIIIADFLVLNKIDLVCQEELHKIKKNVQSINAMATLLESAFCDIDADIFFQGIRFTRIQAVKGKSIEDGCGRPLMKAGVFRTSRKISLPDLRSIIQRYSNQTQRIKGYVLLENNAMASVQTVFNNSDIKLIEDKTSNTALILMGEGFNLSEFSKDFRKLTR